MEDDNLQQLSNNNDMENDSRYLIMDYKYNEIFNLERSSYEDERYERNTDY